MLPRGAPRRFSHHIARFTYLLGCAKTLPSSFSPPPFSHGACRFAGFSARGKSGRVRGIVWWRTNSLAFGGGSWIIIHTKYSRVLYDTILHSANLFETKLGQEGPKTTFCPTLANDNEKVLRKQQRRLGRVRYRVTRQVDD